MKPPICEVHKSTGILVTGDKVYPHRKDLYGKKFWICTTANCDARCGEHAAKGGFMAARITRTARMNAHAAFDSLWKEGVNKRFRSREGAYRWLSKAMDMNHNDCHIGFMDVKNCYQVVYHVKRFLEKWKPKKEKQPTVNPYGHGSNEYYEFEAKANGFTSISEYLTNLKARTPKCPSCGVAYGFNFGTGDCNCSSPDRD